MDSSLATSTIIIEIFAISLMSLIIYRQMMFRPTNERKMPNICYLQLKVTVFRRF